MKLTQAQREAINRLNNSHLWRDRQLLDIVRDLIKKNTELERTQPKGLIIR